MNPQSKAKTFTIAYSDVEYRQARSMAMLIAKNLSEDIFKGVKDFKIVIADSESKEKLDKAVEALKEIVSYKWCPACKNEESIGIAEEVLSELGVE